MQNKNVILRLSMPEVLLKKHKCQILNNTYLFVACVESVQMSRASRRESPLYMSAQYGELRSTTGWDRSVSLGHPR